MQARVRIGKAYFKGFSMCHLLEITLPTRWAGILLTISKWKESYDLRKIDRVDMDKSEYPFAHHVPMDLRGGVRTYVDVDTLPLSDTQKRLVLSVQGLDTKKERYCLAHHKDKQGRVLVAIKGLGKLDGYRLDLLSGKVYDASGRHEVKPGYHYDKHGNKDYLMVKGVGLHRIIALTWLRLSGQLSLLDQAMENPSAYPAHHREP